MTALALDWQEQADEPQISVDGRVNPDLEDSHWQNVFWCESYYRKGFGYDDYAPAYCVGYIGYAQYGGSFADAEKSLSANWERIRGASRLTADEAMQAIRAAWNHAEDAGMSLAQDGDEEYIQLPVPERTAPAYAAA